MDSLRISIYPPKNQQHQNDGPPFEITCQRETTVTTTREHSFHSSSTSRPFSPDSVDSSLSSYSSTAPAHVQTRSGQSHQQSKNSSMERDTPPSARRRSSVSTDRGGSSVSDKHSTGYVLRTPFNKEVLTSTRKSSAPIVNIPCRRASISTTRDKHITGPALRAPFNKEILALAWRSPDKDLDRLATQLLEQLDLANGPIVDDDSTFHHEYVGSASTLSSKPDSFVRHRPRNFSTEAQAGNESVDSIPYNSKGKSSNANHTSQQDGYKNAKHSSKTRETTMAPNQRSVAPISKISVPVNATQSANQSFSSRMSQQAHGLKWPAKQPSTTHPPLDTIYAHIVDLPEGHQSNQPTQKGSGCILVRLLRHAKGFCNIRSVKNHVIVCQADSDECLGSLLSPPPGSSPFDVQLVLCGLLRRNSASPYELYNFFLENGFFAHLSLSPTYTQWVSDYSVAVKGESPFYWEGSRVGLEGDMDFLRTVFQQWCDAWHDWRLGRPI